MADPSWENDVDLTLLDADNLQELTNLRVEEVVIWAMVMGIRTSRNIASRVGWSHDWVMVKLREHKAGGLVYDVEGTKSIEWFFCEDGLADDLIGLSSWVNSQRQPGGIFNPREEEPE